MLPLPPARSSASSTFTCDNENLAGGHDLPIQETLNWYLSRGAEFANIVGNWHTIDNYRRFLYLKAIFRRFFESDLEDTHGQAPPAGWKLQLPKAGWDPRSKTIISRSVRGRSFLVAERPGVGEAPARVHWAFNKVPKGTYNVSINLPATDDIDLKPDSLAPIASYLIEITAGGKSTNQSVTFPLQSFIRKQPDDKGRSTSARLRREEGER